MRAAMIAIFGMVLTSTQVGAIEQHSVDGLKAALTAPLSQDAIKQAQEFDDALLSEGRNGEQRVYLITDERSKKVNHLASKLLAGMGEDPSHWVVRVLDTTPVQENAFVVGGRYVYVFTGLLEKATSDDELAFVLGHELGHSLLKQNERRQSDTSMQLVQLIALIGAIKKGNSGDTLLATAKNMHAQYSQQDEAEADALGAAIAFRAGFDPLRGSDFFTRAVRSQDAAAPGSLLSETQLQTMKAEVQQLQNACAQWRNAWNGGQMPKTQPNADKLNAICADAETKRLAYNKANQEYYTAQANKILTKASSSHPESQARVAALAAIVEFLAGRRDVDSLAKYKNANLVMLALQSIDSPVLKAPSITANVPAAEPATTSNETLETRLRGLKNAFEAGLITKEEYEQKRKQLLAEI